VKNLLEYQEVDKKRLALLQSVEGGKIKTELTTASKVLNDARVALLDLENDAKNLQSTYNAITKHLNGHLKTAEKIIASKTDSSANEVSETTANLGTLENQLETIARNISAKLKLFEEKKSAVIRAQTIIKNLTPQLEASKAKLKPQLDAFDAELVKIAGGLDKDLFTKYKARRKTEMKPTNIVVPIINKRCGACHFEMPLSLINKTVSAGYILCEECGKILYKDK